MLKPQLCSLWCQWGIGSGREKQQISRKNSHRNILRCPFIKMCVTVLCGLLHCCLAVSVFSGTAAVASALEPTWGSLQVVRGLWLPPMAMYTSMGTLGKVRQWHPGHLRSCLPGKERKGEPLGLLESADALLPKTAKLVQECPFLGINCFLNFTD